MDNYCGYQIAYALNRIANALEKMTAPGGQDQGQDELRNQLTMAFQEEALRFQAKDEQQLLGFAERKFGAALHGVVGSDGVSNQNTDNL